MNDLEKDALANCFSDFYTNLAVEFYAQTLNEYIKLVEYKEAFDSIDVISIPYNYDYIPVFE